MPRFRGGVKIFVLGPGGRLRFLAWFGDFPRRLWQMARLPASRLPGIAQKMKAPVFTEDRKLRFKAGRARVRLWRDCGETLGD